MADVYFNLPAGSKKPKSSKYKFNFDGNTYHANTESELKMIMQELKAIDKLQDKNKKFMK